MATFDASQVAALGVELERESARAGAEVAAVTRKAGKTLEQSAKSKVPVESGDLQRSITLSVSGDGRTSRIAAEVGPTEYYGRFVENGTSKMSPRPFLQPALDEVGPQFEAEIVAAFERDLLG